MELKTYISKEELELLLSNNISFKECLSILNVSNRTLKKYRKLYGFSLDRVIKDFSCKCHRCDNIVDYKSTSAKEKVYCSRSCANKREHTEETKQKMSISAKLNYVKDIPFCLNCNADISHKKNKIKFCSRSCGSKYTMNTDEGKERIKNMVKKSVISQSRRSKNEILFYEKCNNYFNSVENNIVMFNGWDADIIVHDYKIAVLWNGVWHYKQIYKSQSLKQIQNRDKIKIKEIIDYGYEPYVIKDMGKFSIKKVDEEFNKFIEYINKKSEY